MTINILRIDGSARRSGSITRGLNDAIVARFADEAETKVTLRDLADPLPQIDEAWVGANFTPLSDRSDSQRDTLALSDSLVAEVKAADILLIGAPIYNFGVPASMKAWIDQIARAGETFRYTANGPEGLLSGKRAIVTIASGGTKSGSEIDFATNYLRHVLGFLGITKVDVVAADQMSLDAKASQAAANSQVADISVAA